METKNKKELQIKKNSFLYFSLGLAGALILSYAVLEMKTITTDVFAEFHQPKIDNPIDDSYTIQPVIERPQVQKPQTIIDTFIPIDNATVDATDNPVVVEKPVISNPTTTIIVPSNTIKYVEPDDTVEVPWILIEDVPVFPGCEKVTKDKQKECFQAKIQAHIKNNFNYPKEAIENDFQGMVFINFIIEKDGTVSISNLRGPHKSLEIEAKRIMMMLPKMKPGMQRQKPVRMSMSIPITFKM